MIKYILFPVLFLSFSQQENKTNFIDWSAERKLTWKDFLGKPVLGTDNAALTSSHINFNFGYGSSGFKYSITCRFDKTRSWVRVKTDYILAHEQAHFDIAEIHARKLKRALDSYKFNEATASEDVNNIYERVMKEHHRMQQEYDLETDHSRKPAKQQEWLKKIAAELKTLEPFANYR